MPQRIIEDGQAGVAVRSSVNANFQELYGRAVALADYASLFANGDWSAALNAALTETASAGAWLDIGSNSALPVKSVVTIPSGARVRGSSAIVGARASALTATAVTASGAQGVVLDGIGIRNNAVTGAGRSCLALGANTTDLIAVNCSFDQDPADGNSLPGDYEAVGIRVQNPGVCRVHVGRSRFKYLKYGVVVSDPAGNKAGAWDADEIWVVDNYMDMIASEGVLANLPGDFPHLHGRIIVRGNRINIPRGVSSILATKNANGLGIGLAGARKAIVSQNIVRTRQQAIHIEDSASELVVTDNILSMCGYLASTSIGFVAGSPAKITDSAGRFVAAGFEAGDVISVSGSASNNGDVTIASVTPGEITLAAGKTLTTEATGASVVLDGTEGTSTKSLIHVVTGTVDLGYGAAGVDGMIISGNHLLNSKDKGISVGYSSTLRAKKLLISGNRVSRCNLGIEVDGNVDSIATVIGNLITDCTTAGYFAGSGDGLSVDQNSISDCTTGISFGDNKFGVSVGNNPMRNVTFHYTTSGVPIPVSIRELDQSFEAAQAAGTGLSTPWRNTVYLGDFAVGRLTVKSRDAANSANYAYTLYDISWDGTSLTISQVVTLTNGSHATAQTPQMSGKFLQTRARIVTTSAATIRFDVAFTGLLLQRN